MRRRLFRLAADREGSVAIEFALLGPTLILMMMGIFQVGFGMQNYNAMRSASADIARYAVINYQTSNRLTDAQLETYGRGIAARSPYNLKAARITLAISTPTDQRVTGALEKQIAITYRVPTLLGYVGIEDVTLRYNRPVFLMN
jgi:Flp pilus assembly protein TadG